MPPDPPTQRTGATSPQPPPPPPSPPSLPVVTKEELLAELSQLLGARGIAAAPSPPASSPTYGQRTTLRREAFDAVQRWVDRAQGSHINFHTCTSSSPSSSSSSGARWLPWHVYSRMRDELGRDIVAVYHSPPTITTAEEDAHHLEHRTIAYLGVLVQQMVRALPTGPCEKGALIRRDARGLLLLSPGPASAARDRYEKGLKAVMWLTLQLGPGASFFLDGGTDAIDGPTADRLVGVLLSPETRNKLWLHFCGGTGTKKKKGKGSRDHHAAAASSLPPSSYQEIVLESRQFTVRSCQFSLAPPGHGDGGGGGGGCRRISELSVRVPPKEPHPVEFTKVEGGKGHLKGRFRDLKQLFQ
ncbi:hypothetical protein F4775DRAFT_544437 [Biscogniauxia sp. FL1348]|nr:hypothetical protein F4775DRAFT_544437 [Biscogniauxia sp. FL1348]